MMTSTSSGGAIRSKRILKPWAKAMASPAFKFGAICSSYIAAWSVSGNKSIITSAQSDASESERTVSPASSAFEIEPEPSLNPTQTSIPDSFKFRA